jgi:enoyl-CoA hydratase/carnithine racemase
VNLPALTAAGVILHAALDAAAADRACRMIVLTGAGRSLICVLFRSR